MVSMKQLFRSSTKVAGVESGASRITVLIFGSLVFAVLYLGYATLPKFYRYYEVHGQAEGMASRAGIIEDKDIRRRLAREIKRYDIPVDPEAIEILRGENSMEINLQYEDTLWIPWFDGEIELHTFEFNIHVKESFTGRRQRF